jgi:hypothetical protein
MLYLYGLIFASSLAGSCVTVFLWGEYVLSDLSAVVLVIAQLMIASLAAVIIDEREKKCSGL